MKIEKAIEVLKMENELMQFDPMTGEIEPIELQNQDNQDLYKANLVAINALEKQIPKKIYYLNYGGYNVGNWENCEDWEEENE